MITLPNCVHLEAWNILEQHSAHYRTFLSKSHWDLVEGLWTFLDAFSMKQVLSKYYNILLIKPAGIPCVCLLIHSRVRDVKLHLYMLWGKNMTTVDWSLWKGHSEVVNLKPGHWSMQHATCFVVPAQDHNYPQACWSESHPFHSSMYGISGILRQYHEQTHIRSPPPCLFKSHLGHHQSAATPSTIL